MLPLVAGLFRPGLSWDPIKSNMSHIEIRRGHNLFGNDVKERIIEELKEAAVIDPGEELQAEAILDSMEGFNGPTEKIIEYIEIPGPERIVEVKVEVPVIKEVIIEKRVEVPVKVEVLREVTKEVIKEVPVEVFTKVYQSYVPVPLMVALGVSILVNVILVLNKLL